MSVLGALVVDTGLHMTCIGWSSFSSRRSQRHVSLPGHRTKSCIRIPYISRVRRIWSADSTGWSALTISTDDAHRRRWEFFLDAFRWNSSLQEQKCLRCGYYRHLKKGVCAAQLTVLTKDTTVEEDSKQGKLHWIARSTCGWTVEGDTRTGKTPLTGSFYRCL